jgi:hypothetical protein
VAGRTASTVVRASARKRSDTDGTDGKAVTEEEVWRDSMGCFHTDQTGWKNTDSTEMQDNVFKHY